MGRIPLIFLFLSLSLDFCVPEPEPEHFVSPIISHELQPQIPQGPLDDGLPKEFDIRTEPPYVEPETAQIIKDSLYQLPKSEQTRSRRAAPTSYYSGPINYYKCAGPEKFPGRCKPLASCSYYSTPDNYEKYSSNYQKSCQYGYGDKGVCCPETYYTGRKSLIINYDPRKYGDYDGKYVQVSPAALAKASKYAQEQFDKIFTKDSKYGRGEDDDSYWGNGIVKKEYVADLQDIADLGFYSAYMASYLYKEYGYNPASGYYGGGLSLTDYVNLLPYKYRKVCLDYKKKCYYSKYRSIDGSCNNLKYSFYGQALTAMAHLRIPKYADKVYEPKLAYDGSQLPPARHMRNYLLPDKDAEEKSVNMLYVNFGQYVAHDLVHVLFYQTNDGEFFDCCFGYKGGFQQVHPKCYTIDAPQDPFYVKHGQNCLNMARSIIAPNYQCELGYANQLNRQTPYVDASPTYGVSKNNSDDLRTFQYGQLQMTQVGDEYVTPISKDAECFNVSSDFCFKSGDLRTNIHPGLTIIQIYFARFHNFCAKKMQKINPSWDDERLFQECRKITIAVYQHIVYTEYLPMTLGWKFMYDYGILPVSKGFEYDYDETAIGRIFVEFSGAAFRFHSSVYGKVYLLDEYYKTEKILPLETLYNSAQIFKNPKSVNSLTRGYLWTPKQKIDAYYDPAITELLLKDKRHFGLDLATMNLLRGRELGFASYNDYREVCGLPRAKKWEDLLDTIDEYQLNRMKTVYGHVDNIELYSGGIVERPVKDSLLGPTWWCIVGYQFQVLKRSDRYFYDYGGFQHSFTLAQLDEIRKMSMSALLCMITTVKNVPPFAFRTISPSGNPTVSCDDYENIPRMSFTPWKASAYAPPKKYY